MTGTVMPVWWFFVFQFLNLFLFLRHTELLHPIYASNKSILFTTNNKQLLLNQEFSYASLCSQTVQSWNKNGKLFPQPDP